MELYEDTWPGAEESARNIAQAKALKEQAKEAGLRFEVYLPPQLAEWLLGLIENETFASPSHATSVLLEAQRELEPHHDLRSELLKRRLAAATDDPSPGVPAEEVLAQMRARMAASHKPPAVWQKTPSE